MQKRYHFISGLPRSGSTLLSAILSQNPKFNASITSPMWRLCGASHEIMTSAEMGVLFGKEKRQHMLRRIFDAYYAEHSSEIVFDTNRAWTGRMPLLMNLFPNARVICCVRNIGWIIDSLERIIAKHPLDAAAMFRTQPAATVYGRVETIMNSNNGFIGLPWTQLREAWYGPHTDRLLIVPYDHLVKEPKKTIEALYKALGEPLFQHDFENVGYDYPEYDVSIGIPEIHKVKSKVQFEDRQTILPPDIFSKYVSTHFWDQLEANSKNIQIL